VLELHEPEEVESPPDLMEALRLSIEQSEKSRGKKRARAKR
jgi:non-homologous end joining protein Ku